MAEQMVADLAQRVEALEAWVREQLASPPAIAATAAATQAVTIAMDAKVDAAIKTLTEVMNSKSSNKSDGWLRSVLESKSIQEIGMLDNPKHYRQGNKKMKKCVGPHKTEITGKAGSGGTAYRGRNHQET